MLLLFIVVVLVVVVADVVLVVGDGGIIVLMLNKKSCFLAALFLGIVPISSKKINEHHFPNKNLSVSLSVWKP